MFSLTPSSGAFDTSRTIGFIEQPAFAEMGLAEQRAREQGFDANYRPNSNDNHPIWNILKQGKCIWVNECGERFADESVARPEGGVAGWAANAFLSQRKSFAVLDAAAIEMLGQDCMDLLNSANDHNTKFQGQTLEELATAMGIDPAALQATVDRYNELCEAASASAPRA